MIRHTEKNMVYLFFIDIFSLPIIFWFADDVAQRADNLKIQTLNFCLVCLNTAGKEILKSLAAKKKTREIKQKNYMKNFCFGYFPEKLKCQKMENIFQKFREIAIHEFFFVVYDFLKFSFGPLCCFFFFKYTIFFFILFLFSTITTFSHISTSFCVAFL